ncbi:MAG TPA: DUF11 domain-containing protein [Lacipirellula sp.]
MLPSRPSRRYRVLTAVTAAACALAAGCTGLRCPRIDPTGERCFIWPKDEVIAPVGAPAAIVPPVIGNPVAPPVVTDPIFPTPTTPAVTPATTIATPLAGLAVQPAQDHLTVTPGRVLAPVGSEVVLKASICTTVGYTLANQEVEWMLGRNGVGQFVELGGKGLVHPPLIPWFRGEKIDNYLARGYTADGPLCIDRGTPDPTDDVNINRGDAWVSVTSANEGTSHITAYTPAVQSWDTRKAAATIYWIDAQWTFPPPSLTASGSGETLTTLVTTQTDGTPIEGWIVRYEVVGGQASEVRTGADGRAAVQVSPTGSGTTTQVNIQLIRPANFAGSDAPQLVIGNGSTVITWGGSAPYLPPSTTQPMTPPIQTGPTAPVQETPITPPPSLPAAAPAQLELEVQGPNPAQPQVSGTVRYTLIIRNVGDAPATAVAVTDEFDTGLIFPLDPSRNRIRNDRIGTIGPRDSRTVNIDLEVSKAGELCQTFTVEYAEGAPLTRRVCLTAVAAAPQREGGMRVNIDGPLQGIQGQTIQFTVTVRNTGQIALVNITTEEEYPTAVLQVQPQPDAQPISGRITRQIPRLDVGQQKQFTVTALCLQSTRATAVVRARAETDPPTHPVETADDHDFEVLLPQSPPPTGGSPPQPPAAVTPLSVVVTPRNPELLVGARSALDITVTNKSAIHDGDVALRVYFPPNLTPDPLAVEGPPGLAAPRMMGEYLTFDALPSLPPGETVRYVIPFAGAQSGVIDVIAQAVSRNVPGSAQHSAEIEVIGNRR